MEPNDPRPPQVLADHYRRRYEIVAKDLHTLQDVHRLTKEQVGIWWYTTIVMAITAAISLSVAVGWPLWFGIGVAAILFVGAVALDQSYRRAENALLEGEDR